jgi:L-alanine-DL-glutamate epimerase-like enolase superfamily enzyme
MLIREIRVYKKDLKLIRPYKIAFKEISSVENGIVEIRAGNGLTGYGAFNPSCEVVNETLQDALNLLDEENLQFLAGRDIREINQLCYEVQLKFKKSPGARTGLEIALYDLFTQYLGVPLAFYLGRKIKSMPTSITIGIKNVQDTLREGKEYIDRKFKIIKIKTGSSVEEDIERIVRFREVFGKEITVITDANQGYSPSEILRFYQQTKDFNISLIEQPHKAGDENQLIGLPQVIRKRIVLDESLVTSEDARKLVQYPDVFGYFNIKLMKCGGISEALRIAEIASVNGLGLMWGCNDESIISITAALHAAFSCSNTEFIDLDGSLDLAEDVVNGGFILKDGIMTLPDRPGLGLQYD